MKKSSKVMPAFYKRRAENCLWDLATRIELLILKRTVLT
jgi:hypothetical protein